MQKKMLHEKFCQITQPANINPNEIEIQQDLGQPLMNSHGEN